MPYIGFEPTASDTLSVFKYVATGSQTTFTGADANGATLSYDVGDGSCQVWLNGVRLDSSDITATNGTSVVLAACTAGDIVHVQATKAFLPSDAVSASTGGTFSGAVVAAAGATVPSGQTLPIASGATIANSGTATGFPATDLTAIADGSVGAPSFAISGDTHTGIYWPGADQLGLTTAGAAGLLIDATGAVTKPLQPAFYAWTSVVNTVATGNTTELTWNSERFDINADFDLTGERFTAPVAGVYLLQCTISSIWGMGSTDGGVINLILYKNGSNYDEFGRIDCATGVDFQNLFAQIYMSGTLIENAAADDYYEVFAYNGTGSTISLNYTQGYGSFQGVLLG